MVIKKKRRSDFGMKKRNSTPFSFLFPPIIILALVFFILPDFNLIDFLPDFLAFAILYFALEKIAELDSRVEIARKYMLGFALLNVIKFAFSFYTGGFAFSSDLLLISTLFFVANSILFFVTAQNLFEGLNYTLMRNNAAGSLNALTDAKTLTFFFGFAKLALNFIPQIFSIIEVDSVPYRSSQFFQVLDQIKNVAILFTFTASLILGIYWFTVMLKLLRALKNDTSFLETAYAKYDTEVIKNIKYLSRKRYLTAKYTSLVGFVLFVTLQLDGRQRIPWFAGAMLLAFGAWLLSGAYKNYTGEILPSLGKEFYFLCSALTVTEGISYFYRNTLYLEIYLKFSSFQMLILALLAAVSALLLILVSLRLLDAFRITEEKLFDVKLKNRYMWQKVFLALSVALRLINIAAQPLREYFGFPEIIAFVLFVSVYLWYLKKEE